MQYSEAYTFSWMQVYFATHDQTSNKNPGDHTGIAWSTLISLPEIFKNGPKYIVLKTNIWELYRHQWENAWSHRDRLRWCIHPRLVQWCPSLIDCNTKFNLDLNTVGETVSNSTMRADLAQLSGHFGHGTCTVVMTVHNNWCFYDIIAAQLML